MAVKNLNRLEKSYKEGLTQEEADLRIKEGFSNKKKNNSDSRTYWQIIVKNVFTFFNILLIIIGVILLVFKQYNSCVFLIILALNLGISLFQDFRSRRLVNKLKLIDNNKVKVIRNGKLLEMLNKDLVIDDIVYLTHGDQIPCDSTLIFGSCRVDESLLTGESEAQKKKCGDSLLGGTYLLSGEAYIRIEKVGNDNYVSVLEKKAKKNKFQKSQMYIELNYLFKIISVLVIIIGLSNILEFLLLSKPEFIDENFDYNFNLIGQSIVGPLAGALVSLIPSGMYLLTSTSLTVASINLFKSKVIVQDMYSIETLARMDTLCIDKTGTITDGTMKINKYIVNENVVSEKKFKEFISNMNYQLDDLNFTSHALNDAFNAKNTLNPTYLSPFDSKNKYSLASFKEGTICVGAYGFVNIKQNKELDELIQNYSSKAIRVMVVGYSNKSILEEENIEFEYAGLILIQDNIRKNVKEIIELLQESGVTIKVISGDDVLNVKEISKMVGINNSDEYIDLTNLSDEEIKEAALKYSIFGRVTPEQKEIIVLTLKENKHVVGMFGDGINDALSLKQASVSITLNNASKAAQNISNFVIVDNDFGRIPEIIKQGRKVINNLQRTCSLFLVKTLFSLVLNVFFLFNGLITNVVSSRATLWPFLPNNFYAWEILALGAPAFFLALEPNDEKIKGTFLKNILIKAFPYGLLMSITVIFLFVFKEGNMDADSLRTISTYFMSIAGLFVLLTVCIKFNTYRAIVFGSSAGLIVVLFMISIYGDGGLNLLALKGDSPRYLPISEIDILLMMIAFFFILYVIGRFTFKYIKKVVKK